MIDLPGFSWFPDLISSWFSFFCKQENTTCEYPAFHGLFNKTPVGHCYTMVWRVQFVSPSTHHWDQIWNDQANWYCTTDCTRHGVSIELLVCKWALGQCLLIPFTLWLPLANKASSLLTLLSPGSCPDHQSIWWKYQSSLNNRFQHLKRIYLFCSKDC